MKNFKHPYEWIVLLAIFLGAASASYATDYNVGPGQTYTHIGDVPWYALVGGDNVYIHWQATPYFEKLMISTRATSWPGLRVIGVVGPSGQLPIIDGNNATTSANMHWKTAWLAGAQYDSEFLGVVTLMPNQDANITTAYIDIENLAIRNGQASMSFTGQNGVKEAYAGSAAAIYAKCPQHLKIINCEISDSMMGFFSFTRGTPDDSNYQDAMAEDITLSGDYFHGNGGSGNQLIHTVYIQANRTLIEKCRFGPMNPGASGNQIKSRSAGDIIRYNYMEGEMGGRFLDLVEDQDSGGAIAALPYYGHDFVYGNLFLVNHDDANTGINIIHWDGDHYGGGRATTPGAHLYFYDNTWVIDQNNYVNGGIFSMQDAGDDCPGGVLAGTIDVRNNIFYMMDPSLGALWWASCTNSNLNFANNWITGPIAGNCGPGGWGNGVCVGSFTGTSTNIVSAGAPGFVNLASDDVHLTAGSAVLGKGAALAAEVKSNALGMDLTPNMQYVYHLQTTARSGNGGAGADLGALEFGTSPPVPPPPPPPPPPANACDLNNDGSVTAADVQSAVNQVLGAASCATANLQQTNPATCTAIDVQRVVNAVLGGSCVVGP